MHLGAVYMHIELELRADCFDVLETFLVIGPRAANPDLHFVFDEGAGDFAEGANDAFEG